MEVINQDILTGVISAIFATFLLYAITKLLNNHILPWYRKLIHQGIDISGEKIASYDIKFKRKK